MLQLKNVNGDETAIQAYDIAITQTLGNLSTLNFSFVADERNQVGADMMIPRTLVTEPKTGEQFRILTSNPVPNSKYRLYTVTANQVGQDLHDTFIEEKLLATQSLVACLNLITKGTPFKYVIVGSFKNYSFSEGFGGDYADTLLNNLASDFGFECYFDGYTIQIAASIGKTDAFLYVDGANVAKISTNEDYSTITTYMKGYAGKANDQGTYPISAEYTSPLAAKWGKIWGDIYTNENMTHDSLLASLKSQIHDFPDVQYSLGYVDFEHSLQGFENDSSVGNYGYLRDRYGIDVKVRVQSRTIYPQETRTAGSITFGNTTFDPIVLQNQIRQGWKDNAKLGKKLAQGVNEATSQANLAYQSRLVGQQVGTTETGSGGSLPLFTLKVPDDNSEFGLKAGVEFAVQTTADGVVGLNKAIEAGTTTYVVATDLVDGLMSATDKHKLDGISDATTEVAGLMSAADKVKLDKLNVEPVSAIQIKDSTTGSIYLLTVVNGEIKLSEGDSNGD